MHGSSLCWNMLDFSRNCGAVTVINVRVTFSCFTTRCVNRTDVCERDSCFHNRQYDIGSVLNLLCQDALVIWIFLQKVDKLQQALGIPGGYTEIHWNTLWFVTWRAEWEKAPNKYGSSWVVLFDLFPEGGYRRRLQCWAHWVTLLPVKLGERWTAGWLCFHGAECVPQLTFSSQFCIKALTLQGNTYILSQTIMRLLFSGAIYSPLSLLSPREQHQQEIDRVFGRKWRNVNTLAVED